MTQYSQHELDAKIHLFMKKKMHQFPELANEPYYIEPVTSIKPVEKHRKSKVAELFAGNNKVARPSLQLAA